MAISLRAVGTPVTLTRRTNTTVNAPAGAVNGSDYVVVAIEVENSTSVTISTPSGWTQLGTVQYSKADPWVINVYLFGRVHDGASSWTFNHASADSSAVAEAWQGVDLTTPADVTAAANNGSGTTSATLSSVTIATAGAQEIALRAGWDGNAITPPAGWTERHDAPVLWVGDRTAAVSGATGTTSIPHGNGADASPWGTIHAALRPAAGFDGAVSGTVAVASAASGSVQASRPVAGTVAAVTTATGGPTSKQGVSGTVPATSTASGAATALRPAAGTVPVVSAVSGAVDIAGGLAVSGTVAVLSAASGSVQSRQGVSGTAAASTAVSGTVQALRPVAGVVPVVSAVSGTVDVAGSLSLSGTVVVLSAAAGSVQSRQQITGQAAATSTVSGDPASRQQITGTIPAVSDVTGAPTARYRVDGVVLVVTSINGTAAVSDAETPPTFTLAATLHGDTLTARLATDHLEVSLT